MVVWTGHYLLILPSISTLLLHSVSFIYRFNRIKIDCLIFNFLIAGCAGVKDKPHSHSSHHHVRRSKSPDKYESDEDKARTLTIDDREKLHSKRGHSYRSRSRSPKKYKKKRTDYDSDDYYSRSKAQSTNKLSKYENFRNCPSTEDTGYASLRYPHRC